MKRLSREMMQRQFKLINYIGLAMITSVFVYAAIVISINNGYILYNQPQIFYSSFTAIKYILVAISILFYFIIKLIKIKSIKSLRSYFIGTIIIFALCDAISIYGLVVFLLSTNPLDFYIFMAISMLYFFMFYPRYDVWERLWDQETH